MDIPALLLAVINSNIHSKMNYKFDNDSNTGIIHNNMKMRAIVLVRVIVTATVLEIVVAIAMIMMVVLKVLMKAKRYI